MSLIVRRLAPAKVNLFLHLTGRRADGYHLLQSLVGFCHHGDMLELRPAEHDHLIVTGPFAHAVPFDENSLMLALQWWRHVYGIMNPVEIRLHKYLPAGAGLGGGTSDAAALLHLLCENFSMARPKSKDLIALGADVPVCFYGAPALMQGVGEQIHAWRQPFTSIPVLLVNPGMSVATSQVFQGFHAAALPYRSMMHGLPTHHDGADLFRWLHEETTNMLQATAEVICPMISEILDGLAAQQGCGLARMSGSGATCFGLFDTVENGEAAATRLQQMFPGCWVQATKLQMA